MSKESSKESSKELGKEAEQQTGEAESKEDAGQEIQVKEAAAPPSAESRGALASLADIEQEVERAFDRFLKGSWRRPSLWEFPTFPALREAFEAKLPKVNVIDRDQEILIEAELPGMKKQDIEVSLAQDSVTIKASREEETEEHGEYHRKEISREFSARTVGLPCSVDASGAKAVFEDGLLSIALPKTDGGKRQSIPIE